jgi:hypothetical protein
VIVEKGETLINCLAYIDLNPLRADLVKRPEDYRWNSIGYHVQTNNRDHFLSTDFGLKEFNVKSEKERIRRYRRYVYEAGALNRPEKGKTPEEYASLSQVPQMNENHKNVQRGKNSTPVRWFPPTGQAGQGKVIG